MKPMDKTSRFARRHFVQFLILIILVVMSVVVLIINHLQTKLVKTYSLEVAAIFIKNLEGFRTLYTSEVVAKVQKHNIKVVHDYEVQSRAIPLPATMTMKLADHMNKSIKGVKVRLYSDYPFPWRVGKGGDVLNAFEKKALLALRKDPHKPYYEFTRQQNKPVLRYAEADLMRQSCVSCHNSHPKTPKNDWRVGDVRGVLAVELPLEEIHKISVGNLRRSLSVIFLLLGGSGAIIWGYVFFAFLRGRPKKEE